MVPMLAALAGCATPPPRQVDNACAIFAERPAWYEATRAAERKWGTPIGVQLAIIRQESSFREDALPPRDTLLGIPMWWRVTSAYGYTQAIDSTWAWYIDETGNRGADRDDFDDAADFVGWYTDLSQRSLGISKWDGYNQYLAYHEGHGGWKRKTYRSKGWLTSVAKKVGGHASTYNAQLAGCRQRLDDEVDGWWPFW